MEMLIIERECQTQETVRAREKIAFALTGLGGSNAYGAGFLQAALDCRVEPDIISCTSGMIHWVWHYLEARDAARNGSCASKGRLYGLMEGIVKQAHPYPAWAETWNEWAMAAFGVPGVFRWAREEYWKRFLETPLMGAGVQFPSALYNLWWPAQCLVPTRPDADFETMARVFNHSSTAVCFNSLLPETGTEYLHVNDAARRMLDDEKGRMRRCDLQHGKEELQSFAVPKTVMARIDAESVKDALWLSLYGPHGHVKSGGYSNRIDGAYLRSVILSELTMVDRIVIPRPVSSQRLGFPANYFENQDFQTELWWNASYAPQAKAIQFVNRLVDTGKLDECGFRKVRLEPVEIDVDRGYFTYFREDMETFERGYNQARAAFERSGLGVPA